MEKRVIYISLKTNRFAKSPILVVINFKIIKNYQNKTIINVIINNCLSIQYKVINKKVLKYFKFFSLHTCIFI